MASIGTSSHVTTLLMNITFPCLKTQLGSALPMAFVIIPAADPDCTNNLLSLTVDFCAVAVGVAKSPVAASTSTVSIGLSSFRAA